MFSGMRISSWVRITRESQNSSETCRGSQSRFTASFTSHLHFYQHHTCAHGLHQRWTSLSCVTVRFHSTLSWYCSRECFNTIHSLPLVAYVSLGCKLLGIPLQMTVMINVFCLLFVQWFHCIISILPACVICQTLHGHRWEEAGWRVVHERRGV